MTTTREPLAVLLAILCLATASGITQDQPPATLLEKARRTADEFVNGFSRIVAEEDYHQEITAPRRRRQIRSEFLLVKVPGANDWIQFRDVFEVDGKPVGDHQPRLLELFQAPGGDPLARASDVTRDSARYNLTDIGTLNMPLNAVAFLQSRYRNDFRFVVGPRDQKVGPAARVLTFEETGLRTLLTRGRGNGRLPAHGRIWLDESTGRPLKTELQIGRARFPDEITTSYQFDANLQLSLPLEKEERFRLPRAEVIGRATYSAFRRFDVQTHEVFR